MIDGQPEKPPGVTWRSWKKSDTWKKWTRHRRCTRKVKLGNAATARARALGMGKRPYQCQYCGYWHIGAEEDRPKR